MLVFVYGSLLRGEENHAMMGDARFVSVARTAARYTLFERGRYPALVDGGDARVAGELFEVDEERAALLDDFEGHPDVYARRPIELDDGAVVFAYLFVAPLGPSARPIPSGDFRAR